MVRSHGSCYCVSHVLIFWGHVSHLLTTLVLVLMVFHPSCLISWGCLGEGLMPALDPGVDSYGVGSSCSVLQTLFLRVPFRLRLIGHRLAIWFRSWCKFTGHSTPSPIPYEVVWGQRCCMFAILVRSYMSCYTSHSTWGFWGKVVCLLTILVRSHGLMLRSEPWSSGKRNRYFDVRLFYAACLISRD